MHPTSKKFVNKTKEEFGFKPEILEFPEGTRTANAEEVKAKTGWSIGGVPPFCHKDDTKVLMDKDLMQYDEVWAAGGTPKAVFPISPKKLKECSGAEVADIKES